MARIEVDPNYTSPTFARATAATDIFKKEDVQGVAAALSTHVHDGVHGLAIAPPAGSVNGSVITDGTITSAKITDGTIDTVDLKDGSVTSAKIADGTIATADHADASVTNAKLASDTARLNLCTNGGFEIWQRGPGPYSANGAYTADRWSIGLAGTDSLSVSRSSSVDVGSNWCAACAFTLGTGAGGTVLSQKLSASDYSPMNAVPMTFSARVNVATANAVRLGMYNGTTWTYGAFHPGSGGYQTLSVSVPTGTAADHWVGIYFAANCTAYVDNAMLVVGSQPADYAPLHPSDDLARCLRYYEAVGNGGPSSFNLTTYQAAGTAVWIPMLYRASKAANPTLTKVGTWAVSNCGQPGFIGGGFDMLSLGATATALGVVSFNNNPAGCYFTAEANP